MKAVYRKAINLILDPKKVWRERREDNIGTIDHILSIFLIFPSWLPQAIAVSAKLKCTKHGLSLQERSQSFKIIQQVKILVLHIRRALQKEITHKLNRCKICRRLFFLKDNGKKVLNKVQRWLSWIDHRKEELRCLFNICSSRKERELFRRSRQTRPEINWQDWGTNGPWIKDNYICMLHFTIQVDKITKVDMVMKCTQWIAIFDNIYSVVCNIK